MTWAWCVRIHVEVFGSLSMFVIFLKEMLSCCLLLIENGPMKGHVSNFTPCCINTPLNWLLPSPHPISPPLRYIGEKLLDIWKYLDWYCWTVCLCTCWIWLAPFWWWKAFPNLFLTIFSIMVEEQAVFLSTSSVSKVSNNYSIMNWNLFESWCLCGLHSNIIYSCSNLFM